MLKNLVILISLIAVSRFIGLPANFSPLLALAVFMPRLSDDVRIQYLVPVSIVTFTNLFLDQVNIIIFATMLAVFLVTPMMSRLSNSLLWGSLMAIVLWHILVNGAVWVIAGGSILKLHCRHPI